MRIVIQRAGPSKVTVNDKTVGEISSGLVLLVCITQEDNESIIQKASQKILNLRIFESPDTGKMDLSILDTQNQILAISQFTLAWKGKKGNRPSFDQAMDPIKAKTLFDSFCRYLSEHTTIAKGEFGAHMQVQICNDGPVTFCLDF